MSRAPYSRVDCAFPPREQGRARPNAQAAALILIVRRYPDTSRKLHAGRLSCPARTRRCAKTATASRASISRRSLPRSPRRSRLLRRERVPRRHRSSRTLRSPEGCRGARSEAWPHGSRCMSHTSRELWKQLMISCSSRTAGSPRRPSLTHDYTGIFWVGISGSMCANRC